MATSPPNTPEPEGRGLTLDFDVSSTACVCGTVPSFDANRLATTLGVAPLYKQQASARWTTAANAYNASRRTSPASSLPSIPAAVAASSDQQQLMPPMTAYKREARSPISLEDIAVANRTRYRTQGARVLQSEAGDGPLELEAIAAVAELASVVQAIYVSDILPRTPDLIFVNIKTIEGHPYTLELTMKGWRVASSTTDSMYGDYNKMALHTTYWENARKLLQDLSPGGGMGPAFAESLTLRLQQIEMDRERTPRHSVPV